MLEDQHVAANVCFVRVWTTFHSRRKVHFTTQSTHSTHFHYANDANDANDAIKAFPLLRICSIPADILAGESIKSIKSINICFCICCLSYASVYSLWADILAADDINFKRQSPRQIKGFGEGLDVNYNIFQRLGVQKMGFSAYKP